MDPYVEAAARNTTNYISTRSVAIVVRDRSGKATSGTATSVKVGRRFLLCTAGHVVEDMQDDQIALIPAGELARTPIPFRARSCRPGQISPRHDVAWLEVDPDIATKNNLRFLDLADLSPNQDFDRAHPFLIHGYPHCSAVFGPKTSDVESTVAFTMIAEPRDVEYDATDFEIALEYPPRDPAGKPLPAPEAFGFSGGGVWRHPRHDEFLVTSPEQMKLVAINTKWHESSAVLYATRIERWLELVAADFPDIRAAVEAYLESGEV